MKKYIITFLISLNFYSVLSQININQSENKIKDLEQKIKSEQNDSIKIALSEEIEKEFSKILLSREAFYYEFKFQYISVLKSDDNFFLTISWSIPLNNGEFKYFGFFAYQQSKKRIKTYNFNSLFESLQSPEMMASRNSGWHPILYYQIITKEQGRKTYYTLLGWDGKDALSNIKIIDIIRFSGNGLIILGEKLIQGQGKKFGHIEFEFNERSVMTLKYMNNAIVFDHLAPIDPQYKGIAAYYGPDGTYDGLIFEDGKWNLIEAIDIRNPKMKTIKQKNKKSF